MAKFVKKQNIVISGDKYTNKQGVEKTRYNRIGELVTMEGENGQFQFMELYHMPGAKISIFDIKERDDKQKRPEYDKPKKKQVPTIDEEGNEIKVGDIPF